MAVAQLRRAVYRNVKAQVSSLYEPQALPAGGDRQLALSPNWRSSPCCFPWQPNDTLPRDAAVVTRVASPGSPRSARCPANRAPVPPRARRLALGRTGADDANWPDRIIV